MRKKIIWITVCLFLILLILSLGGNMLFLVKKIPQYGLLNINGVDITRENVMIQSNYANLPLTEVMSSLGMKVAWIDNYNAEITYKDNKYTLNLLESSLINVGQNYNFLLPPPGGKRFYTIMEKELILDSNTIKSALHQMGIKVNVIIDHKKQVVYIYKESE